MCAHVQDGVVLALAPLHALEASSIEPFKPAGVKRKRHHTYQKGYSWGGYNGVMLAALACKAVDLLQRCTLLTQPLLVMLGVYRAPVLVGGRYLKTRRDVPQSPWFEDGTALRIGTSSVQVRTSNAVKRLLSRPRFEWMIMDSFIHSVASAVMMYLEEEGLVVA